MKKMLKKICENAVNAWIRDVTVIHAVNGVFSDVNRDANQELASPTFDGEVTQFPLYLNGETYSIFLKNKGINTMIDMAGLTSHQEKYY